MEDVAARLGVSKGTLYLYVASKEALFELAVRYADAPDTFKEPAKLPLPTPAPGAVMEYVGSRLASDESFRAFGDLLRAPASADPQSELAQIVHALYRALHENRHAIKLVDVCAIDHPELSGSWFGSARGGVTALLAPFLERRIGEGLYSSVPDVELTARYILETVMLWAIHIHWDPHPEDIDHDRIEDTVVPFIVRGLINPT